MTRKDCYHITPKEGAEPFQVTVSRKVPWPFYQKAKEESDRMLKSGVISKIDKPTSWCAPMVVAPKSNGKSQGLRGPQQGERVSQKREPNTSSSRYSSGKIGRFQSLRKTRCKLRILADKACMGTETADLSFNVLSFPFYPCQFCVWEIPEEHESDSPGIRGIRVQHRWRFSSWKKPRGIWRKTRSRT